MDTIINKLAADPGLLRNVTVAGPLLTEGGRTWPMWILQAAAPSFGAHNAVDAKGKPNGVNADHAHPVRVLAADLPLSDQPRVMRPRLLDLHLVVGAQDERYRRPAGNGEVKPDPDQLLLGWTRKARAVTARYGAVLRTATEGADESEGKAPFVHVVVEPLPDGLPKNNGAETDDDEREGERVIPLAPNRLVAGRIGLRVNPNNAETKWLVRLGLNGANAKEDWHTWPTIWLVPDGIEFDAWLPFPASANLLGRILLAPDADGGKAAFRATLVAPAAPDAWLAAWNAIVPAAGDASETLAGLKFAGRRDGKLPGLSWPVIINSGGQPDSLTVGMVDIDGADCALSLVSPAVLGTIDGVATLRPARLRATQGGAGKGPVGSVDFTFADGRIPAKPRLALSCRSEPGKFLLETGAAVLSLDLELVKLSAGLRAAYGLETPPPVPANKRPGRFGKRYERPLIPAFVALENGWLQLPVPNLGPVDANSDQALAAVPKAPAPNVLGGFLRMRHAGIGAAVQSAFTPAPTPGGPPQASAPWSVTVEQAPAVAGTITLTPGANGATLALAVVTLYEPVLSTRGLLWLSTDRPDAQEALPRLGAGPGAFIDVLMQSPDADGDARSALTAELGGLSIAAAGTGNHVTSTLTWSAMALHFGVANRRWLAELLKPEEARETLRASAACIVAGFSVAPDTAKYQAALPAVAWLRHPVVPLAATMPMTRAGAGASRPLESRDLIPFALLDTPPKAGQPLPQRLAVLGMSKHPPLLALHKTDDGTSPEPRFDLMPLPAWPQPPGAVDGAAPDRGIGLAMVGVAGAELRVRKDNGKLPGYGKLEFDAAVRYDLPLLDQAYATAALPPPETPPSAQAQPPAVGVATTLDWPLLAAFWGEQERKHQNSRVVDSYLSGFMRVDTSATVKAGTLIRGLAWSVPVQVDTKAVKGQPAYGGLRLDGADAVSGNTALAGYEGWLAPDWKNKKLTPVAAQTAGASHVLGFSPATIRLGDFHLDNALNGAAIATGDTGKSLIARELAIGGAAGKRLLSLKEPLSTDINGGTFHFWFKDVLFDGGNAVLNNTGELAFDSFDADTGLAGAGFEWRFAGADVGQAAIALKLGRSEIPFFGFRLEPLRLLDLSLGGDAVQAATLLCRLSLSPRTDGGNLVKLVMERAKPGQPLAARFELANKTERLCFSLSARDGDNGAARRLVVTAGCATAGFGLVDGECAIDIAGVMVRMGEAVITPGDGVGDQWKVTVAAKAGAPGGAVSRLRVERLSVTAGYRFERDCADAIAGLTDLSPALDWDRFIDLFPEDEFKSPTTAPVTLQLLGKEPPPAPGQPSAQTGRDKLTLLGIASDATTITADEANGALCGVARGVFKQDGVAIADFQLAYAVRLGNPDRHDGTVALVAGLCDGVLTQVSDQHRTSGSGLFGPNIVIKAARLKFSVATDDDGKWQGTATISALVDATSDIGWPPLKVAPDALLVPLPGAAVKPRTGRVQIALGVGHSASHLVSWTLADHALPLNLAHAICRADSSAVWAVPVVARHLLERDAKKISWAAVESLAVGRPAGLIPRLPGDITDDLMVFAARYRRSIKLGNFGHYDPGMPRAGLGAAQTVLQGALGERLRRRFWYQKKDGAADDRIMLAGGFLGLLTLAPGMAAAPLLRLPVLAGLGVTLAQDQLVGGTMELSWSDGPAARAVALSRPTAPSPANESYGALAAALLAGSLTRDAEDADDAHLAGSLLVEQSFDHRADAPPPPPKVGEPVPVPVPALANDMFFPAAAVAVDAVLNMAPDKALEVASLSLVAASLSRPGKRRLVLAASLAMRASKPMPAVTTGQAVLYVLGRKLRSTPWRGATPDGASDALRPYLRALAPAIDADPVAFVLDCGGPSPVRRYVTGGIASLALDGAVAAAPAALAFADEGRGLPAAPASKDVLRWLAPPQEGAAGPIRDAVPPGGAGAPSWQGSGLAGLARRMALPASAGPSMALAEAPGDKLESEQKNAPDCGPATAAVSPMVWLSQTQVPVYLPLRITGLRGAPIGWLQPAPPLARLPLDAEVIAAIRDSAPRATAMANAPSQPVGAVPTPAPTAAAVPAVQSFMPAWLGGASVGERAGVMTLRRVRLLTRLDAPCAAGIDAYDAALQRFGAPAQAGSSFGRKLRTPRPGPLPPNTGDPVRDRRVQASAARPFTAASAVIGSADIVQGGHSHLAGVPAQHRWAIEVVASPETASVVSERWDGSLRLACRIDVRFEQPTAPAGMPGPADFLRTVLKLLANESGARLKIGERVLPYRWLLWKAGADLLKWRGTVADGRLTRSADIILTLDPRQQPASGQTPAALPDIAAALAAAPGAPVELQWTVKPASNRKAAPIGSLVLALDTGLQDRGELVQGGGERAPLTLRMPLYPALAARGALPMTPASLIFGDPAYNRDLAGPPASAATALTVLSPTATAKAEQRGELRLILSADRARVNTRGVITLMLDIAYERRLDELAQAAAEGRGAVPAGDLKENELPDPGHLTIMLLPAFGTARALRLDRPAATVSTPPLPGLAIRPGTVYELPLAMLREADGAPARLRAGDVLQLAAALATVATFEVRLFNSVEADFSQVKIASAPPPQCVLALTLTDEAVIEPPPALYLVLQRSLNPQGDMRLSMPLHAQSPLPRRVDLMNPARGFRTGLMERSADFVWYLSSPATMLGEHSLAVHKSDRNGQGYWPESEQEFLTPEDRNLPPAKAAP